MFNRYTGAKDKRAYAAEERKGSMDGLLEAKFDKRMLGRTGVTRMRRRI